MRCATTPGFHFRPCPRPACSYYGGQRGFELVLDLLDDACQGLLERIRPQQ